MRVLNSPELPEKAKSWSSLAKKASQIAEGHNRVLFSWDLDTLGGYRCEYEYDLEFIKARAFDELVKLLPTIQDYVKVSDLRYEVRRRLMCEEKGIDGALSQISELYFKLSKI